VMPTAARRAGSSPFSKRRTGDSVVGALSRAVRVVSCAGRRRPRRRVSPHRRQPTRATAVTP
jgi:hypothetical protein